MFMEMQLHKHIMKRQSSIVSKTVKPVIANAPRASDEKFLLLLSFIERASL